MSFRLLDQSILKVPGKMEMDEMAFLAALAAKVPEGGHIVEIGCFYGRSTNVMGAANPNAHITSIDTFEDVEWTSRYANQYFGIPVFGRAAFDEQTKHLPLVTAIEGYSPQVANGWNTRIHMYFEDAVHGNPGLRDNMDFWTQHLRPGGIVCGHDYSIRFADIPREVSRLAKEWGTRVEIVGSLWALRKPHPKDSAQRRARGVVAELTNHPNLMLRGKNKVLGSHKTNSGFWCGAHLSTKPMVWMMIDPIQDHPELTLEYRVGHPDHGTSDWIPAGAFARLRDQNDVSLPFNKLAIRYADKSYTGKRPDIFYRTSSRRSGYHKRENGISGWAKNGSWAMIAKTGSPVTSFTAAFLDEKPRRPQSAFVHKPSTALNTVKNALRKTTARLS